VAGSARSGEWYRSTYRDATVGGTVVAATAGVDNAIAVLDANHTIYVQRISVTINTLGAQTIIFQDDASTPVKVLFIEASAAAGTIRSVDFGAKGFPLTAGKNLDIAGTAAPAYSYEVEAYQRQTATIASTTINRVF
jgi:hypothetical protein